MVSPPESWQPAVVQAFWRVNQPAPDQSMLANVKSAWYTPKPYSFVNRSVLVLAVNVCGVPPNDVDPIDMSTVVRRFPVFSQ